MDIRSKVIGTLLLVIMIAVAMIGMVVYVINQAWDGALNLAQQAQILGLTAIALLLVVLVTGRVLARRLARPVQTLVDCVNQMDQPMRGKLEYCVPYRQNQDVIGELARAIIALSARHRQAQSAAVENAQAAKRQLMLTNNRLDEVSRNLEESQTQLEANQKRLSEVEAVDSATNLPNMHGFHMALENELKRGQRSGKPLSVALYRVADFERLVKRYGGEIGDAVLTKIAEVIVSTVRSTDLVARYSDDSVVLMLPETNGRNACRVVEDIKKLIGTLEYKTPVRASEVVVGVGLAATDADPLETLNIPDRLELAVAKALQRGAAVVEVA